MSVYIKGMEMPTEGEWISVNIFPDGKCVVHSWCGEDFICAEKLTAIPVPEHGRLVDADALCEKLEKAIKIKPYLDGAFNAAISFALIAPTIIPAGNDQGGKVMEKIRYSDEFICPKCGRHTALVCRTDGTHQAHCMICDVYYDVEIAETTNADRIRAMSDEELAEYLIADIEAEAIRREGRYLTRGEINRAIADCLSWLKAPANKEGVDESILRPMRS